jgi:hypothetical protein
MKPGRQLIELSFCIVCALAPSALWTLDADSPADPSIEAALLSDRESIHGHVSAMTEGSLTVEGKVINATSATAVLKGGKPVALADIRVGDKVKVSAAKGNGDSLQAVSVEVTSKATAPRPSG